MTAPVRIPKIAGPWWRDRDGYWIRTDLHYVVYAARARDESREAVDDALRAEGWTLRTGES